MTQTNRTRSNEFKLRTTNAEASQLRRRITKSGRRTFQSYALKMLLNGKIETYDYSDLQKLRIEVNRIGQNINQIVKYVNAYKEIDRELLLSLQNEVNGLQKIINKEFSKKEVARLNGRD